MVFGKMVFVYMQNIVLLAIDIKFLVHLLTYCDNTVK